ncbi:MAG: M48 family metallopeptidase [Woeseiaceae bacterium]|nr:M48 family metallopeptidase [Woeseiaceae bacterium]
MNFFDAQDQARRSSRRLVVVYLLATASIVAGVTLIVALASYTFTSLNHGMTFGTFLVNYSGLFALVALVMVLVIVGATGFKTATLSSGGGKVAESLGATQVVPDVSDPKLQRLRNVVEEMAIASGVPVPDIYVLEQESGINAFAAGYETGDAAVAVTRGALEVLDRQELQGVIAHEFSHILNGDMRLNIRLMGVLFGIMVLALIGRTILRGGRWGAFSSRRGNGAPVILATGVGLLILGWIGIFFARVIKASVSRQREYLADASAVQFTRQTDGIANALKKIGGYTSGSYFEAADPEEVSHMLFGTGSKLSGLFATHPPLTERIQALDPAFTAADYPAVDRRAYRAVAEEPQVSGFDSGMTTAMATGTTTDLTETIAEMVGDPEKEHIAYASGLRRSVPAVLYDAAHSQELAYLLVVALILDRSGRTRDRQLGIATERLGAERVRIIREYFAAIEEAGREYRLPLLDIAFPALKRRPEAELKYLLDLANRLIEVDGEIDLYEYCFYRILVGNLQQSMQPLARRRQTSDRRKAVRDAAIELLRVIAHFGHDGTAERQRAFEAGAATFGKWGGRYTFDPDYAFSIPALDRSLATLLALNGSGKRMLLEAVTATVMSDKTLSVSETELIRAICASLDCPLPPILTEEAAH